MRPAAFPFSLFFLLIFTFCGFPAANFDFLDGNGAGTATVFEMEGNNGRRERNIFFLSNA